MKLERIDDVGIFYIDTDRNNSYNLDSIAEANEVMDEAEQDDAIRGLVVTSSHKTMFSPGVDLPTLMGYSRSEVRHFFEEMTALIHRKFVYPKPEVYALNGHAVAGGCIMALAGDYRLMVDGPFKIGLMEIDIGLAAPAGTVKMVRFVLGGHLANKVLLGGETHSPQQAFAMGLVDEVVEPDAILDRAIEKARLLGSKPPAGYQRLKRYLRGAVAESIQSLDKSHMDEIVAQWFDEETQERLTVAVGRLVKPSPTSAH